MPLARQYGHIGKTLAVQMLCRQPAAQFIVTARRKVPGNLPADQHIGDVFARQQVKQGLGVTHMGVAHDQPGHRAAQGVFGAGHLPGLLVVGVGHKGQVASLFGGAVDAVVDGRHHQIGQARHQHADLLTFAQFQVGCLGIRPIIQLFCQCANPLHHLGRRSAFNPGRVAIEHSRHRGHMNTQSGRHGFQSGGARLIRHGGKASGSPLFNARILPEQRP